MLRNFTFLVSGMVFGSAFAMFLVGQPILGLVNIVMGLSNIFVYYQATSSNDEKGDT